MGPNKVGNAWPWQFGDFLLATLQGVSIGATGDAAQAGIPFAQYRVTRFTVRSPSANVSAGFVGLFTGAGGTGTTVVANAQLTSLTTVLGAQNMTIAASALILTASSLYFRVGTAVAGETVDIDIFGTVIPDRM